MTTHTSTNKFTLWNTTVDLDLPKETFPIDEEMRAMDEIHFHPEHGYFEGRTHGLKLHYQKWLPTTSANTSTDDEPTKPKVKGICIYHHGIQAHFGMSCKTNNEELFGDACVVKSMREAGYILYALDAVGHGYSEGERFVIPKSDWRINCDDLADFAMHVCSEREEEGENNNNLTLPLFLLGNSYGACLSIHVARRWMEAPEGPPNLKGICILAPAVVADLPPPPIVAFLTLLANHFPTYRPFFMPDPTSPDRVWDNEDVAKEFTSDRRREMQLSACGKKLCLGTALGVVNALQAVREVAIPGFNVPFYVGHGTKDYVTPMSGTEYFLEHATTPEEDRCVNFVKDAYHDLLSSKLREEMLKSMIEWMNGRI